MTSEKSKGVHLSLVIPAYNETVRLVSGLYLILAYLTKQPYTWEVIVIDDGSREPVSAHLKRKEVRKILHFPVDRLPISIIRLPRNSGKGKAIAEGVSRAKGEYVIFTDIDLSVPITEVKNMLIRLRTHPVVISSRRLADSKIVVHQSLPRELSGRIFTFLSNAVCGTRVADVTCGFKGFRAHIAKSLFAKSRINRWVFDTELVFLARKYHIEIHEMPVSWVNKSGSKVKAIDSVGSFADLLRIRWNDLAGVYN